MMNWMRKNLKKKLSRLSGNLIRSLAALLLRYLPPESRDRSRLFLGDHAVEVGVPDLEVRRYHMMKLVRTGKIDGRDLLPRV